MRISDWSSDVCSSDLLAARRARPVVIAMLAFGIGNGSVFQLVPQRFSAEIGVMTGLVGMAGGVGGFTLARSEARSVGKECGSMFSSRWVMYDYKIKR